METSQIEAMTFTEAMRALDRFYEEAIVQKEAAVAELAFDRACALRDRARSVRYLQTTLRATVTDLSRLLKGG